MKNKIIIIICFLGIAFSILLSWIYFHFSYFEPDTTSYSFQAKLFARGKLSFDAPPEYGFSSSPHVNILNGKWYSKYPFGNALMLTLGEFVKAHWLIPALVTGFALVLLYLMIKETYGYRIAIIAAVLGLISPATLGMGCTWFSEPVSRFYLAIYLLALIRLFKRPGWIYPALSGFALGYAFNTRPIPAVAFGAAGALLTLYWILRSNEQLARLKRIIPFFVTFALMIGLCMAWNTYFTGSPLKFTHNAAQPYDKMGFGKRTESYDPDLDKAFVFTPKYALERIWRHTLPCVSFNTLGWGYYRPNLLKDHIGWPTLWVILLALPLILMLIPLFHSSRNRYDLLFFCFLLFNLSLYFFFYFDGTTWGITPVNARYYTEVTLLGIIPLVARGMYIIYGWIRRIPSKLPIIMVIIFLTLLTVNTVYTYVLIAKPYQNWGAVYQKLPRIVKQQSIHNAVIFIPGSRDAPIGDYPFKSLKEADIVYFKLGPAKVWRLNNSDWQSVYDQYFKGRNAYIYEGGQLKEELKVES
jgi:4-amino-4-deoxy-L-arabinose transferase-like glycosyltransferase